MIYTEASQAIQTELGADLWAEDYSYVHPSVACVPQQMCRRRPMRWIDTKGNEVDLLIDEGGGRHLMVRPTGKKPYKPVRGIRMPRPTGVA